MQRFNRNRLSMEHYVIFLETLPVMTIVPLSVPRTMTETSRPVCPGVGITSIKSSIS